MPLAEITFFAQKKCYLSEQRRHFSGQNGVFVGRCRLCGGWGGRCLPFGWKFQSKTDITIRFGVSWQTAALTSTNESLGSDDSVFFFSRCFAAKTGNITGYRCCPGGRKELLVVVHSGHNLAHSGYNLDTTSGVLWVQLGHNSCPLFTPLTQRCAGQLGTVVHRGNSCHLPGDGCCQRNRSGSSFLFLLFVYL